MATTPTSAPGTRPTGGAERPPSPPPPKEPPPSKTGETTKPPEGEGPPQEGPKYINGTSGQVLSGAAEAWAGQVQEGQESADDLLIQKFYSPDAKTPDAKAKEDKRRAAAADSEKFAQRYAEKDKSEQSHFEKDRRTSERLKTTEDYQRTLEGKRLAETKGSEKQISEKSAAKSEAAKGDTKASDAKLLGQYRQPNDPKKAEKHIQQAMEKPGVPKREGAEQNPQLQRLLQKQMVLKRAQEGKKESDEQLKKLEQSIKDDVEKLKAEDPELGKIAEAAMAEVDTEFKKTKEAEEGQKTEEGKEGEKTKGLKEHEQVGEAKSGGEQTGGGEESTGENFPAEIPAMPPPFALADALEVKSQFTSVSGPGRAEGEAEIEGEQRVGKMATDAMVGGYAYAVRGEGPPPHRILNRGRNPQGHETVHVYEKKSKTVAVRYNIDRREYIEVHPQTGEPTGRMVNPWGETVDEATVADMRFNIGIRMPNRVLAPSRKGPPTYFADARC